MLAHSRCLATLLTALLCAYTQRIAALSLKNHPRLGSPGCPGISSKIVSPPILPALRLFNAGVGRCLAMYASVQARRPTGTIRWSYDGARWQDPYVKLTLGETTN